MEANPTFTIKGIVSDEDGVSEVLVNGKSARLIPVGAMGTRFEQVINLTTETTLVEVKAVSTSGDDATKRFSLIKRKVIALGRAGGRLWAVCVGVSKYRLMPDRNLRYASNDARDLAKLFRSYRGYYDEVIVDELTDERATKQAIQEAIDNVYENAGQKDLVIIFFAGHGDEDRGAAYFLPSDGTFTSVSATGVALSDVRNRLQVDRPDAPHHALLIIDACHGAEATSLGEVAKTLGSDFKKLEATKRATRAVITASLSQQQSIELDDYQNGLFTHHLLMGLEGQADDDSDGFVTLEEAYFYTSNRVRTDPLKKGMPQNTQISDYDPPMIIGPTADRLAIAAQSMPTTGALVIRTYPDHATVHVNGVAASAIGGVMRRENLAPGSYAVRVTANGYAMQDAQVEVIAGQDVIPSRIVLEPLAISRVATLAIKAPSSAVVYVNGGKIGTGSLTHTVAAGKHQIEVRRPGYRTKKEEIDLRAGERLTVSFELKRLGLPIVPLP